MEIVFRSRIQGIWRTTPQTDDGGLPGLSRQFRTVLLVIDVCFVLMMCFMLICLIDILEGEVGDNILQ